ncbi:putative cytochrome b2 protein [Phaeoacremonium minimum UCRPA7]|uniref:Putative cytochrome b2 protein n=1 Tax=Phaeoacremonium minimum (strain UCR-PA7) TaxID=1286976 RepID=R8BTP5_PHAM7|nr:putative cytochrome b2 protein [Phaeoacremonium minimum UCRPA7]EOO02645.1 putative cytochrome b2 protein [Phaeoacremonium minimum UCRPA7]
MFKYFYSGILLTSVALAARPFLNEPDTGITDVLGDLPKGQLPNLTDIVALNDFEWAARNYLPLFNYTYYRNGAGGEWSYRNNLEVYNRYRLRPRTMLDISNIEASLRTTILGYNFSSPFFISPCARGAYGHPDAELNFVQGAASGDILYITSGYSSLPIETIADAATDGQILFTQLYVNNNDTANQVLFDRVEAVGSKAIVWSVDSPGSPSRQRAARFGVGSANTQFITNTWEVLDKYRNMTSLPIILKGIQTVADARAAIDHGVPAIILSNHGGRNLDGSPSSLEIALEIYNEDPTIFSQIEILADGGIRHGTDALRLLALGVKAVGLGRPFMYSNVFGLDGVKKAVQIMHTELMNDAANLGVPDIKAIDASYVDWTPNFWYS